MHSDQVDVREEAVARLVSAQFPAWRELPVRSITSHGTVNALFRLGDDLVLRFLPRPSSDQDLWDALSASQTHARLVAPHVPVPVPGPVALGDGSGS
jgi:aminoglycoside phosphotransferase (APT) family kinase protein